MSEIEPAGGRRRGAWLAVVRAAVGFALLTLVVRAVDWREFLAVARTLSPAWVAPVAVVTALDRVWMGWKWRYLLRGLGLPVTMTTAVRHYFYGSLVGMVLPFHVAGDLARAIGLGGQVGDRRAVLASVVFEKVAGASASGLLAAVSLAALLSRAGTGEWRAALPAVIALGLAAAVAPLLLIAAPLRRLTSVVATLLPASPRAAIERVVALLARFADLRRVGGVFYAHTLLEQGVPLAVVWMMARGFGLDVSVTGVVLVMPAIMFLTRLPVSVQAIGVQEGLYVVLFGLIGVVPEQSLALSLGYRAIDLAVHAVGSAVLYGTAAR